MWQTVIFCLLRLHKLIIFSSPFIICYVDRKFLQELCIFFCLVVLDFFGYVRVGNVKLWIKMMITWDEKVTDLRVSRARIVASQMTIYVHGLA